MERIRVVVVDDHPVTLDGICSALSKWADVEVVGRALNGTGALELCQRSRPDVVLLDLHLPDVGGIEIIRQLSREVPSSRIVVLTMEEGSFYVREAKAAGAVDYLVKSMPVEEIRRVVLRVVQGKEQTDPPVVLESAASLETIGTGGIPYLRAPSGIWACGDLRVLPATRQVWKRGQPVELSFLEYELLVFLMQRACLVVTFDDLLSKVWGYEDEGSSELVKTCVYRLRHKLEDDPSNPRYIRSVRKVGYFWADRIRVE